MAQIEGLGCGIPTASAPPTASAAATGARILLVEDEERLRTVTRQALERLGHGVQDAADGPSALALVERGEAEPDLVVTDLSMPGMDGIELARRLRALRPGLRVLLVSGFLDVGMPSAPDSRWAALGKPFRLQDLARAVRELLEA